MKKIFVVIAVAVMVAAAVLGIGIALNNGRASEKPLGEWTTLFVDPLNIDAELSEEDKAPYYADMVITEDNVRISDRNAVNDYVPVWNYEGFAITVDGRERQYLWGDANDYNSEDRLVLEQGSIRVTYERGYSNFYEDRDKEPAPIEEGKRLNIISLTDEFYSVFKSHYPNFVETSKGEGMIGDVTVKFTDSSNADFDYYAMLDHALTKQEEISPEERIDLFIFDSDFAKKYVYSDYALPLSEIGITDADTAEMYGYLTDMGTSASGELKAVSWHACPQVFAYRRSIAREVFGTDAPDEVQEYVSDWERFTETAELMKQSGYKMLSGYSDAYRIFSQQRTMPWVNEDNEIVVDEALLQWLDFSKTCFGNGYSYDHPQWSEEWAQAQCSDSDVFGFFYATWGIAYTLPENTDEGGIGDWAVCEGPQPSYYGDTLVAVGYKTDNSTLVADIIRTLFCDEATMRQMAENGEFVNNSAVMKSLAESSGGVEFLGGQNPIEVFDRCADKIRFSMSTQCDYDLEWRFTSCLDEYIKGNTGLETALDSFYAEAMQIPGLKRVDTGE